MEESKLHLSIEGENFEEIYSKVQQIKKLIDDLNYEFFCRNQQRRKITNKINVELKKELEKSQIEMEENRIDENNITISTSNEEIKMDDLVQSVINYLYDRFKKTGYISDEDVELFKLLYKD